MNASPSVPQENRKRRVRVRRAGANGDVVAAARVGGCAQSSRGAPAAPKPRDDVRERRGERRAVRLARVRVEPVFVDPRVVRGRGRELRLRQREVRGEVRAIRRRLEMRVEIGHLLREVIGDAARGQRACVVARGGVLRAAGVLADDVGALVQRGELARGGRVRGLAVLAREAQTREAQVRLHGDALGGERGKPQALGQRWRISSLSPSPRDGEAIARGRLNPGRGVSPTDGRLCANGFADKTSVCGAVRVFSIRPRVRKTENAPRTGGKPSSARASHSHSARPSNTRADMAEDEEEAGPTIFEAAADEEITETHWCVDPPNEDFSPSRLPFSLARGLELTAVILPAGSTTAARTATTARATPWPTTWRTSPFATACPSAAPAAATHRGCGPRRPRGAEPRSAENARLLEPPTETQRRLRVLSEQHENVFIHQNRVENKRSALHTACTYVSLSSELRRALHRVAPRVPAHDLPRQAHLPAQHQHGHLARAQRAPACRAPDAAHVL